MLHQFKASQNALIALTIASISSLTFAANPLSITTLDPKATVGGNRSIFMNGIDISSARNQDLRNVHIRISENGDIFITAPQYQVTEEETYTPLSSYIPGQGRPTHQPPQEIGGEPKTASLQSDTPAAATTVTPNTPPAKTVPAPPASPTAKPAGSTAK